MGHALPASIYLALGILHYLQKRALVRDLNLLPIGVMKNSVAFLSEGKFESLGSADLVITDKTGTLTNKNLSLAHLYLSPRLSFNLQQNENLDDIKRRASDDELNEYFLCVALCHEASEIVRSEITGKL